jgi:eukaryotic-like serine/threonine-protein kinase
MAELTKLCPYCAEEIQAAAIRCKHCAMMLDGSDRVLGSTPSRPGSSPPGVGQSTGRGPAIGWSESTLTSGMVVREYTLEKLLGKGGMGEVYKALHMHTGQTVAMKVLFPDLLRDEQSSARFVEEARVMAGLRHPSIVQFIDFFAEEGRYFLVMEYIDGPTLNDILEERPLDWKEAIRISDGVLSALEYAHTRPQPVIHRDIKPANIMLSSDGRVVVTDFGIAKAIGREGLTKTRGVVGTYEYMSPEQVKGEEVSAASDVYSFGITLYRMLTGVVPFPQHADTGIDCMNAHLKAPIPPMAEFREGLPTWLPGIVEKALAKEPSRRFAGAGELKAAFTKARQQAKKPPAPPTALSNSHTPTPREQISEASIEDFAPGNGHHWPWILAGLAVVLTVAIVIGILSNKKSGPTGSTSKQVEPSSPTGHDQEMLERLAEQERTRITLEQKLRAERLESQRLTEQLEKKKQAVVSEEEAKKLLERESEEKAERAQAKLVAKLPAQMVLVDGGDYPVGCLEIEPKCYQDARPRREVDMKAYGIMRREVTMESYDICIASKACPSAGKGKHCNWQRSGREDHPINCVDWAGASAYCAYKGWRLPSEMEWEVAARGPQRPDYPWGILPPNCTRTVMKKGNKGGCGEGATMAVGSMSEDMSWSGAMDMGGNVREWVSTAYQPYPGGTVDGSMKGMVNRGGSWSMDADAFSASHTRNADSVDEKRPDLGFRCAISLD